MSTAGDRRHLVTWQKRTDVPDGQGGVTAGWNPYMNLWARISASGGREAYRFQQVYPTLDLVLTVRFQNPGPRPQDRIVYGSRVFEILAAFDPSESHVDITLICQERAVK